MRVFACDSMVLFSFGVSFCASEMIHQKSYIPDKRKPY